MNMNVIKKGLGIVVIAAGMYGGYYWYTSSGYVHKSEQQFQGYDIRPFDKDRDAAFIKQQNYNDWYLLHASPEYDLDFMMDTHSPYRWEPRTYGTLSTVVLFEDNKPVGFVNYYTRGKYEGTVFLLSVVDAARGKGYGKILFNYAVNELKKRGVKYIRVSVRKENERAQNVYRKAGFTIESQEGGFYFYRLNV